MSNRHKTGYSIIVVAVLFIVFVMFPFNSPTLAQQELFLEESIKMQDQLTIQQNLNLMLDGGTTVQRDILTHVDVIGRDIPGPTGTEIWIGPIGFTGPYY